MNGFSILSVCLPVVIGLHIAEEFVFPGGFMKWYGKYRPEIASGITSRFLIIVNTILLLLCLMPVLYGPSPQGVAWWLSVASIACVNVWFHIKGTILSKSYSPGLITALLLYLPITIYGNWFFIENKMASWQTAVVSFLPGIVYHLFSLYRSKRQARKIT